ncbi:MAG TPA: hypothetical protein PKX05_02685, partial [bacterium]|nr:hypothetical protein [bacterium]
QPTRDKFLLFLVVFFSTFLITEGLEYIWTQPKIETQLYWLIGIFMIENFLTCGVYGCLKNIVSGETLTFNLFLKHCVEFFLKFLGLKLLFVIIVVFIAAVIIMLAEATGNISSRFISLTMMILWAGWLTLPVYYIVLSLFAPIVLFSDNCGVWQSIKSSIGFGRTFLDHLMPLAFLYFFSVIIFIYLPEKLYNISSGLWSFYKGLMVSGMEIGFICSFFLFYDRFKNINTHPINETNKK